MLSVTKYIYFSLNENQLEFEKLIMDCLCQYKGGMDFEEILPIIIAFYNQNDIEDEKLGTILYRINSIKDVSILKYKWDNGDSQIDRFFIHSDKEKDK